MSGLVLNTDVLIVGCGLAGISTACNLCKLDPEIKGVIIERGDANDSGGG